MYRNALEDLLLWMNKEVSKPLILRGARQVGKSTLVRMLASETNRDLVEINLEKSLVHELNNQSSFSINKVITEIQLITRKQISNNSLLFLDEIQAQPTALNALRYFYEDKPDLKVIAAGSLLEVMMNRENFRMPVGRVSYYYLGPMTFKEFLKALGEETLLQEIDKISLSYPPTTTLHEQAITLLKEYYFVGGMPEAIENYIQKKDFSEVREVHESLLQTYRDDIPKYAKGAERQNISDVFEFTPQKLGQKVIFSQISKKHSSYLKSAIQLLGMANVIYPIYHNNCSGIPLKAGKNPDIMKLYFLDIGLYNALMEMEWKSIVQLAPEKLLTMGNIAEQFVVQHLVFRNPKTEPSSLYYWLRDGKKGSAEVDFVFSKGDKIFPLEVKSGASGKMRSLWVFASEKDIDTTIRVDLALVPVLLSPIEHSIQTSKGKRTVSCNLLNLPLYAIENLTRIINDGFG